MRSMILTILALCLYVAPSAAQTGDWSEIRIATEGTYPPWNATDNNGDLIGFELDLIRDLCARLRAKCEISTQNWKGMIPALVTGKFDAIIGGIPITEEREKIISFSRCYGSEAAVFAVRDESALATTMARIDRINLTTVEPDEMATIDAMRQALAGTVIGVRVATASSDFLETYFADLVSIRNYDTLENLTIDLNAGRIDAALAPFRFWRSVIGGEGPADITLIGPRMTGGLFGKGIGIGVRKADKDLRGLFDQVIEEAGIVHRVLESDHDGL